MRTQRVMFFVAACFLLLLPAAASAQSSITGTVRDTSGGVLPGVTVEANSPALIGGARVAVTDNQGLYQIVELRPGTYTVTFTLPSFKTVKREGIDLPAAFAATVNAELAVGALEETVTVSGEAPLVDIRSSRAQAQYTGQTLQALPGNGRLSTLSAILPGAVLTQETDRVASGLSDRAQTRFAVHGAPEAVPVVDGMNTMLASSNTGVFVFNQINFQEVVAELSGVGADRDTGGAQLNMIAKDGGNTFSGTLTGVYAGPSLQSNNINDALIARGLNAAVTGLASIKKFEDFAGGLGGPLMRNKLWFFGAARKGVTQQYAAGIYSNLQHQPASLLYQPDLSRPAFSNDFYRDYSLRLTWQAAEKHKFVVASSFQNNCNCVYALFRPQGGSLVTPEAATQHHYEPDYNSIATWTYPATNRMLITFAGGMNHTTQHDDRGLDVTNTSIQITEQSLDLKYGAAYGPTAGGSSYSTLPRRQYHQQFSVSYVTGSHNFKTGLNAREFRTGDSAKYGHDLYMANTAILYTFNNQKPVSLQLLATPQHTNESGNDIALYAQDQWTLRKLTLNLGIRYNNIDTSAPAQILPAGFFVPERILPAASEIPHWQNLHPRLGASYDLFGDGKTAVKVSLGHYADIVRATTANPSNLITLTTNRSWNDSLLGVGDPRTGNYLPDCDLLNPVANGECGAFSDRNFGKPIQSTHNAADAQTGFNKQYNNWQGSVSVQHELRSGIGLNVGYFRTWYGGFLATDIQAVTAANYDSYCLTAPVDSRLPGGGGNQICGLYDITPTLLSIVNTNNVVTQASNFGKQTQVYNGVDVTLNARFGQGGQFSGGLSTSRTVTDNCYQNSDPSVVAQLAPGASATVTSPRTQTFCHVSPPLSAGTQVKFLAIYPLPWGIQTSGIFQNGPGIPITASYTATNAEIKTSLGRNLAACPSQTAATCNSTVKVDLIPANSMFEPRLTQVDLRLSRDFRLGGIKRLRGNLDIFNVFNASNVLSQIGSYTPPGGTWQNAAQILGGRLLRVGFQFDF